MGRTYLTLSAVAWLVLASAAWSQTTTDPHLNDPNPNLSNPNPNLGDPNPHLDDPNPNLNATQPNSRGSSVNPTMQPDNAQPFGNPNVGQPTVTGQGNVVAPQGISGAATVDNNWRMVRHNGRWWYWTANNNWLYRDGNGWSAYQGRGTSRQDVAQRNFNNQRQRAGYRGDRGFDANAQGSVDSRYGNGTTFNDSAAVRGGTGTNFSDGMSTFDGNRPPLPTALELQRFQSQQQSLNTPYGGTTGGVRNQTAPLGGGATRANTFGTSPSGLGSPGNPNAVPQATPGSPGNPSAIPQSAPGNTGSPATSGGASPAGGIGPASGTSGVGGTGSTFGGTGGTGG